MTRLDNAAIEARRSRVVRACIPVLALLTALISLAMLILWLMATGAQQRQWPYFFLMKSGTAAALLILALGLFCLWKNGRAWRIAGAVCACSTVGFALAALTQYIAPIDLGIDQWIVADHSVDQWPGRTSIGMATGLLLMGTAYLALALSREALVAQALLLAALVIPITTVGGYLYRTSAISVHSALCTLLLCAGGLFLRPGAGLIRALLSQSAAGTVARRLLAAAILLPAAMGTAVLYGEHRGLMGNALGFATLVTSSALFFAGAVWIVAAMMLPP